jgi:SAM-dependent methyltransferase
MGVAMGTGQKHSAAFEQRHLISDDQLSGKWLYGDDFSPDQIKEWYDQEKDAFYNIMKDYYRVVGRDDRYEYEYDALNHLHAFSLLLRRRFTCCVALGCAAGDDVAPLAPVVDRFFAIEPTEKWWRPEIGGKPARYVKPSILGDIDLADESADLATSLSVLHHIPNVSHVVGEIARVLRPGGLFVVREPISWMGDWRGPRPGITVNERGMPLGWFETMVGEVGFTIIRRRLCVLGPLTVILRRLGISRPYAVMPITLIDWLLSEALRGNVSYRRDRIAKKIAPGCAFWLLEKQAAS